MERYSAEQLHGVFKADDSAWTVLFVDPLIRPILPHIARWRRVTPLRLTVAAHLLGVIAAAAFLQGWLVVGALLFELRFVLDCMDGKVARLRGETSQFGAALDLHGDRVVISAIFIAVAANADLPWLAVAITVAQLYYFSLREFRNTAYEGREVALPIEQAGSGGLGAALRRRRITPFLTSVDVEHVVLFVVPMGALSGADWTAPAVFVAALYFGANALRFAWTGFRATHALDQAARSA